MATRSRDKYGWPVDGKPAGFTELSEAVVKAVRFAYKLERKNEGKSIPWNGPERPQEDLVGAFPFKDTLSAENLAYSEKEQNRDALRELVGIAIGLGIEQGRRLVRQSHEYTFPRMQIDAARRMLEIDSGHKSALPTPTGEKQP